MKRCRLSRLTGETRRWGSALHGQLRQQLGLKRKRLASPRLALARWLEELAESAEPLRGAIAIYAVRNECWLEWSVYAACWMRRIGLRPILIYRGEQVRQLYSCSLHERTFEALRTSLERRLFLGDYWRQVASIPDIELVDIDQQPRGEPASEESYREHAAEYARTTAAYDLHVEEDEEGPLAKSYLTAVKEHAQQLGQQAAVAESIFRRLSREFGVSRLITFSGLIADVPAVSEAARRCGWDVAFAEGWFTRRGHMLCSMGRSAFEYQLEQRWQLLGEWGGERAEQVDRFIQFQNGKSTKTDSRWLGRHRRHQLVPADRPLPERLKSFVEGDRPVFLLTPNTVGDSATFRRATLFRSQRHWIEEVCRFFAEHREMKLLIRAHPAEAVDWGVVVKLGEVAQALATSIENIEVVRSTEEVSTYSLIPYARAGLVWISNAGVDLIVRGCPVILAARAEYAGLGIADRPKTPADYFDAILKHAAAPQRVTDGQLEQAKKYLALLSQELTYDAFTPTYRGEGIELTAEPGGERDTFYRVLSGDLPPYTRPPKRPWIAR